MSKIPNKNTTRFDQIEEGELPDDEPLQTPHVNPPIITQDPEESSPSSEIIFQTVTDSQLQSQKKKKKIFKEQKSKKTNPVAKDKERGHQKEKKSEKNTTPKFQQQREISPSFNYSNVTPPNNIIKPPNPYMPPQIQQFYPIPQFPYPMMPHPVPMSAPYPPYMGSYMHGNMPQPFPYHMGGMQMMPPNQMMSQKPITHQVYTPQMNTQMNSSMNTQMNPSMNPPMNNQMPAMNAPNNFNMNQKPKLPVNNNDYYASQYKGNNNQGARDWNVQKTQPKQQIPPPKQTQPQQQLDTRQRNRPSVDRYQKSERHEKEEKNTEAMKKKLMLDQYKSQLKKPLKLFEAEEQLEILQLMKCLSKQSRSQSKEIRDLSKKNHQKILSQLQNISSQSEQKRQSIYKMLQILQFQWILMELKQKAVLNWIMKDQQFLRMTQLTKTILESPLKI